MGRGHPENPGLQEFALACAGRAADQGVWTVLAKVERKRLRARRTHEGGQTRWFSGGGGATAIPDDHRVVGQPQPADGPGIGGQRITGEAQVGDRPRQVAGILGGGADVDNGREE